jgi:Do/DeqQ family serine protease
MRAACLALGLALPLAPLGAAPARAAGAPPAGYADIVPKLLPTVVSVYVRTAVQKDSNTNSNGPAQFANQASQGSGFIIDPSGYIVTNRHVIENASEITVTLFDNRHFQAQVVGSDEGTDIAVIKAAEPHLAEMPLGDSSQVKVGDWVVAIGNPFGLNHTVTAGIVSALGRTGIHPHGYEDFIQTDASINPGNSGGALVDMSGELIGINSAIYTKDGGNIGIGFAIPVNMVKAVMGQIITYGEVKRGVVGIKLRDLTPEAAESLQLVNARGVEISEVAPGSAADRAGIKAGDVAVSMNGVSLESAAQLRNALALLRVGQNVEMHILHNGTERIATLTINPTGSLNHPD